MKLYQILALSYCNNIVNQVSINVYRLNFKKWKKNRFHVGILLV